MELNSLDNQAQTFSPAVIRNVANNPVHNSELPLADDRLAGFLKCERTENVRIRESDTIATVAIPKEQLNHRSSTRFAEVWNFQW